MPYVHKETLINIAPDKYVGKYMMQLNRPPYMATFPIEIIIKNNKLFIHPQAGPDVELKQESETKFFFADGTDQQIEFETDISDKHVSVWHIAWGVKKEMKKID